MRIRKRIEIGYVCGHGHFQFNDDPDGDSCQLKSVGTIYVRPKSGISLDELRNDIDAALTSLHDKIEYWRRNA